MDGEALSQFRLHEQELIHLLFVEGFSLDEVVVHLGVSKTCVNKRRERTLGKLKDNEGMNSFHPWDANY